MISLDNRLKTAAELCRSGKIAADVGCDHAQLACWLAQNRSRLVIASDVRDGPLESARRTVSACGVTNVEIVKSDGLAEIKFADDVIICGMGGELIAQIVSGCKFLSEDTRFILQPMTKDDFLRKWLYKNGFEIDEELIADEKQRKYIVMRAHFTGIFKDIDEYSAFTGKIADPDYLRRLSSKLLAISEHTNDAGEAEKLRQISRKITQTVKGM